jgi:hypothetical protein
VNILVAFTSVGDDDVACRLPDFAEQREFGTDIQVIGEEEEVSDVCQYRDDKDIVDRDSLA